ncbi:MAG TPA: signal recognition particle receptor subunit alpha [Candidatus Nanoarchaeia archaeon]|nr:signal recognition particle receptor subunit alpha [Candidatus Nanoarchaeia archaeon]
MLEKLSATLKKTTDKIANAIFLDKNFVDQIVRDLQRALIEADVNVTLVLQITQKIKQAALDERISGLEKKEHIIKLLHDELTSLLGPKKTLELKQKNRILLVGLYGQGKTTTTAKLASYYAKRGSSVAAISLDVHRPAAAEQLRQSCQKLNIPCFIAPEEKDAKKIWKKHEKELEKYALILIDTAGRDALDESLIKELKEINKITKPTETLLIMAGDIGQTAKKQAQIFKENTNLTGVIITKMDSTAKGGGALTACAEAQVPILFIGTGEKPADLEPFNPDTFLSRLLGLGDLPTLLEKIHSVVDKKTIEEQQKKLKEGSFTLKDLQQQLESVNELGSMDKIMSLIPGLGKAKLPENALEQQQEKMKHWKNAINSMTKEEIENPEIIEKQTSRLQRIAHGSGTTTADIRALIKQYRLLKDMMKSQSSLETGELDQKTMMKLARKFGKRMKF